MVRFPRWGGRGGGRCRGWRRRWRRRRGWSRRGGRRKWPTVQPEAAEDRAEIRSTSNRYLLITFNFTFLYVHFTGAFQKCSIVWSFSLVCFLRACEQKAEQPLSFWHPQVPSKKKPYKVGGNLWEEYRPIWCAWSECNIIITLQSEETCHSQQWHHLIVRWGAVWAEKKQEHDPGQE